MHTRAKILYVDDHEDTRFFMMMMLEMNGFGVMTAGTIAEALEAARDIKFDLFILDQKLPDGSGVELCEKLRAIQDNVPVLYYSGMAYDSERKAAMEACGDMYLCKPVCASDLQEAILKLLLLKEHQLPALPPMPDQSISG
jgi:DNA-binding response OmpR family regulator